MHKFTISENNANRVNLRLVNHMYNYYNRHFSTQNLILHKDIFNLYLAVGTPRQ